MTMRNFILISIFVLTAMYAYSADWDKATRKQFCKEKEYNIKFDMGHVSYCGLDSTEFVEYYSSKNDMSPEDLAISLKLIKSQFVSKFNKYAWNKKINYPQHSSKSNANILIKIIEITEKAGIKAEITLYTYDISKGKQFRLDVKDGRWNSFDELLKENAEKLAVKLHDKFIDLNLIF